ncbi:hypothetical protein O3Q51_08615 [Cryomorphaceae bacterium 1068]|nr:hypothetical protein [Cryomorphaceae bacterium 1068]
MPLSAICPAQQSSQVDSLISDTKVLLDFYSHLSPFDDLLAYADLDLSSREIAYLKADNDDTDYFHGDSIYATDLIFYIQDRVQSTVEKITQVADLKSYNLVEIFQNYELGVVRSTDGKIYNFSLDEKTGGSYRSRVSWMHFTEQEEGILDVADQQEEPDSESIFYGFETNGYDRIDTIHAGDQVCYILIGSVQGCNACFLTYVEMVRYENGEFYSEFYYSIESRSWDAELDYYPGSKTIRADYLTDDLTTDCSCETRRDFENGNYNYSQDEEPIYGQECHCEFVFDGDTFVEIEETVK